MKTLKAVGCAMGACANDVDTALGPWYLYFHPEYFTMNWQHIHSFSSRERGLVLEADLFDFLKQYSSSVSSILSQGELPVCIGGDHAMAMGTWPAVKHHSNAPLGLIWIDAHLDAHTPTSSRSKNFHGMPIAYLLGLWGNLQSCFQAEDIIIIGARSFEDDEKKHLESLGVKIYWQEIVHQRGIAAVMDEAYHSLKSKHEHIGLSIDMDAFDPQACPGVGCPEKDGINPLEFMDFLKKHPANEFIAYEMAEFNPMHDIDAKTAKILGLLVNIYSNSNDA
ncbi:MAG: hypothetical protein EBY16_07090 [Gammaproteobacteria bacterium]|nr:hypothetical protein [Gammaproteobacteria bacterium]